MKYRTVRRVGNSEYIAISGFAKEDDRFRIEKQGNNIVLIPHPEIPVTSTIVA